METASKTKLDLKHGFMKSIIQNQVNRDNYDKDVKLRVNEKPKHFVNHRPRRPEAVKYVPPNRQETSQEQTESRDTEDEEDGMPKTLFRFEFQDKNGQIYKQYVNEGVTGAVLAMRMGHDRKLPPAMVKVLEQRLQEEINKRTIGKGS